MEKKARDLEAGDVFRLHIYGEVRAVDTFAAGKCVKVKLALEDQGRRANCGAVISAEKLAVSELAFTDTGHALEFICRANRTFHLTEWNDGDDDDEEIDGGPVPSPETVE